MASSERPERHALGARVVEGLLFVAAIYALDWLGRALLEFWTVGLPWYPPAGLALAYVAVRGRRAAPAVLAARLLLTMGPGHRVAYPLGALNAVVFTGLTLSLGAMLRQLPLPRGVGPAAWRTTDAVRFFSLALLGGAAFGALAATLDLMEGLRSADGLAAFAVRYGVGDAVGIAVFAPVALLLWPVPSAALRGHASRWLGVVALLAVTGLGVLLVENATGLRLFYAVLVPLGWAAMRGGVPGAAIGVVALDVTMISTWALLGGAAADRAQLVELQAFMLVAAAAALLLGATSSALDAELAQRRGAEARLRAVIDQSVAGFYTAVGERFTFANHYFASLFGYTVEEILALPSVFDLVAPEDQSRVRASFARRAAGDGEAHYVVAAVRKDGSRVVLEVHAVGTQLGGERAVIGAVIDRTALATTKATLRERDEQLRQAQKMEAVGQLAGGVAHDFNNMLTAIGANVTLALHELDRRGDGDASRVVRESLIEIQDAASRSANLTRQLLAFGRKQVLRPRAVQLDAVVRGSLPLLRRLLDADVRLDTRLEAGDATVVVDTTQIEQVLLNLVVNARDAMRHVADKRLVMTTRRDDVRAASRTRPGLHAGRYVVLTVEDVGHGMDDATQARIFEPFFTTKPLGEGTGLGLATVFGIVKQSGGNIYVDSVPDGGTTFSIYFADASERLDVERVAEPAAESPPNGNVDARPVPDGGTVLVVEDEDVVRRVLRRSLALAGYRVLEAGNPADALRLWPDVAHEVGLVVTDMVMPELDGLQLAARLRSTHAMLPVLLVSGYSEALIEARGPLPARTGWLSKPFTTQELRDAVSSMLEHTT